MKILVAHNFYQQAGGEDAVFRAECELLQQAGHSVVTYTRHNDEIASYSPLRRATLPLITMRGADSAPQLAALLQRERPDVAHFHNTLPLISPQAYRTCSQYRVPVVQTLHNYRLLCPAATFYREGRVCEDCLGSTTLWPAIRHSCYRGSRGGSASVAAMLAGHRVAGTWASSVDSYIALTEFARGKLVEGGLPAPRITVKPNFLADPPKPRDGDDGFGMFVGRLSPEKGIATLLDAWQGSSIPLSIFGDGPEAERVQAWIAARPETKVVLHGARPRQEVLERMRRARFLVFPSEWYEGFPMTLVEAMACGLPVLGSRIGSIAEIVEDGVTGLLFEPGDAAALAQGARRLWGNNDSNLGMGQAGRAVFEQRYTAARNLQLLEAIYRSACGVRVDPEAGLPVRDS